MNEQPLEIVAYKPKELMRLATDVAGICRDIVVKTAVNIQGRNYVKCEGWMSIATAHGCIASSRDVEKIDGGWRAIGEIRRISDGVVLATAEGFVGLDEVNTWAKRQEYACRAMAQTRAISRACRAAFAHVVVLMDAGLSTTPAEEVPDGGFQDSHPAPKSPPTASQTPRNATVEHPAEAIGTSLKGILFVDYKAINSKPDAKKPWTLFVCKFLNTEDNKELEASTFDSKIGDALDVLKGAHVDIQIQPGRKQGTTELVSIAPEDSTVPF